MNGSFKEIRSGRKRRGKNNPFDALGGAVSGCCTWEGIATRTKQQEKVGLLSRMSSPCTFVWSWLIDKQAKKMQPAQVVVGEAVITWPGVGRCGHTVADVDEPSKKRRLFIFDQFPPSCACNCLKICTCSWNQVKKLLPPPPLSLSPSSPTAKLTCTKFMGKWTVQWNPNRKRDTHHDKNQGCQSFQPNMPFWAVNRGKRTQSENYEGKSVKLRRKLSNANGRISTLKTSCKRKLIDDSECVRSNKNQQADWKINTSELRRMEG